MPMTVTVSSLPGLEDQNRSPFSDDEYSELACEYESDCHEASQGVEVHHEVILCPRESVSPP